MGALGPSDPKSYQLAADSKVSALRRAAFATLLAAVFLAGVSILLPEAVIWGKPEKPKQCEALTEAATRQAALERSRYLYRASALRGTLREPQNTWSNLAFLFVGVYLLTAAAGYTVDRWMGGVLIYQCLASSLYHASLMPVFRDFDMAGVFAIASLLCVMALAKCFPPWAKYLSKDWRCSAATVGIFILAALFRSRMRIGDLAPLDTMVVLPIVGAALCVAVLGVKIQGGDPRNLGIAALTAFGIGLTLGGLDRVGQCLCAPGSWMQAHSVWHVCAALAALLFSRWGLASESGRD